MKIELLGTHKDLVDELSFRQTISGHMHSDRGFTVIVNRESRKVEISFNSTVVDSRHSTWLKSVGQRVGHLKQLEPQPYWGFEDLSNLLGTKLLNCFFVQALRKRQSGFEYFHYQKIMICQGFSFDNFLTAIEQGKVFVDFDARTGHNHGTKFRMKEEYWPQLYKSVIKITD